ALNRDIIAVVSFHSDGVVRICAEGHDVNEIELSDISSQENERGTIGSAVRGIIAEAVSQGAEITGFDIFVSADIPEFDIISPAAAFEVLILSVIDFCCGRCFDITRTVEIIGYDRDKYISDRISCKTGGIVSVDFENPETLQVQEIESDIYSSGYSLCAVRICDYSGNEFSDYIEAVAKATNCVFLGGADEYGFKEISALKRNNLNEFFRLVNESGLYSAYMCDICLAKSGSDNLFFPALIMSRQILNSCGASQICINGSAGTVQAFVPSYMVKKYISEMEKIFGTKSCYAFSLRKTGASEIKI
nr:hypothetical protein [Ruminococcus sp.]